MKLKSNLVAKQRRRQQRRQQRREPSGHQPRRRQLRCQPRHRLCLAFGHKCEMLLCVCRRARGSVLWDDENERAGAAGKVAACALPCLDASEQG